MATHLQESFESIRIGRQNFNEMMPCSTVEDDWTRMAARVSSLLTESIIEAERHTDQIVGYRGGADDERNDDHCRPSSQFEVQM